MYESRHQTPITQAIFVQRLFRQLAWVMVLLAISLLLGMIGYVACESLSWIDAFINSAMLLGGMGPVNAPQSFAGKLFAGLFALYAGLVFIVAAALLFTPVLHRLLHHFHWDKN
ncbi:MAG TPA: hypothetical protein VIZ65_12195 [Cellvibrionaceae bacterium]